MVRRHAERCAHVDGVRDRRVLAHDRHVTDVDAVRAVDDGAPRQHRVVADAQQARRIDRDVRAELASGADVDRPAPQRQEHAAAQASSGTDHQPARRRAIDLQPHVPRDARVPRHVDLDVRPGERGRNAHARDEHHTSERITPPVERRAPALCNANTTACDGTNTASGRGGHRRTVPPSARTGGRGR